jgi:hypothetical protein
MPLLESIGSGASRGFGLFGKTEFAIQSLYTSANTYAPLVDNRIYTSGTRNFSYSVNIEQGATYDIDSITGKTVLSGDSGPHKIKIPHIYNLSSTYSISIWQRVRQTSTGGSMLMSKFVSSNDSATSPAGNPYPYALNIYNDSGASLAESKINLNVGDGSLNPYVTGYGFAAQTTNWVHWVLTFDGGTARMYRNGSNIGNASTYRTWSSHYGSWVLSGWASDQYGGYAIPYGNFAHFAIWNGSVKNQSDINALYALGPY